MCKCTRCTILVSLITAAIAASVIGVVVWRVARRPGDSAPGCDTYVMSSISGGFTQKTFIDFSSVSPRGNAASLLSKNRISVSKYTVNKVNMPNTFVPGNVAFGSGSLDLKVSAYDGGGTVQSSEIVTRDAFKFASVRTVIKSSTTPGVVEGNFCYLNNNQEADYEILTATTLSPTDKVAAGIWATNHGTSTSYVTIPFTFDPSQDYHEYRIDWTSNATVFYIDGIQQARLTSNVPTEAVRWVWNAWSDGNPNWSNGPPTTDSLTHIHSIEIYKGFTSTPQGSICNVE